MPPRWLEGLGKPSLEKLSQFRRRFELRNSFQFLERGREGVRQAPNRPRPEFLVSWFEVQIVYGSGQVSGSLQLTLDERLVDNHLGSDVRQFTSLPDLNLLAHRFEVPLHPVHANRDAVNQGERLRVFRQHRSKGTSKYQAEVCRVVGCDRLAFIKAPRTFTVVGSLSTAATKARHST